MEQTGRKPIEEVKHRTDDDEEKRQAEILLKGVERGDAARNQVAASDGVRNVLFHFSDVLGIKSR